MSVSQEAKRTLRLFWADRGSHEEAGQSSPEARANRRAPCLALNGTYRGIGRGWKVSELE
jgi:hypothetical protein